MGPEPDVIQSQLRKLACRYGRCTGEICDWSAVVISCKLGYKCKKKDELGDSTDFLETFDSEQVKGVSWNILFITSSSDLYSLCKGYNSIMRFFKQFYAYETIAF